MNFINTQSIKFNNLIKGFFIKKFNLSISKNVNNLENNKIYVNKNIMVLSNKIINLNYNTNLDQDKYSMVYILYRNIHYKMQDSTCYLDNYSKHTIKNTYNNIIKNNDNVIKNNDNVIKNNDNVIKNNDNVIKNNDNVIKNTNIMLSKDVLIIGRKYIDKKTTRKTTNSLNMFCIFDTDKSIKTTPNVNPKCIKDLEDKDEDYKVSSNDRRKFLYNLKQELYNKNIDEKYMNNIIKNCIFLDVEYTNDIYDDFEQFPISKDTSLLFMIGVCYKYENDVTYKDYTVNQLTFENEKNIITNFLNFIDSIYNNLNKPIIVFHWSPADRVIIEKTLLKHNILDYKHKMCFVDLLQIVKQTIVLKSYSLKYISKKLLSKKYDTECQNGFQAMCSVIENDIVLKKSSSCNLESSSCNLESSSCNLESSSCNLESLPIVIDIIEYNKMDTVLLYNVVCFFC
jgi:hypothetical protein